MSDSSPQAIQVRIDVTKVDKGRLYKGKPVFRDGVEVTPKYLNMTLYRRDIKDATGKVFAHYKVAEDLTKEEKDRNKFLAKDKKKWGNDLGFGTKSNYQKADESAGQSAPASNDDDEEIF